jgi:quinol monooxygenase YgiN
MIVEYIRYKVKPEETEQFIQSYVNASVQLDESEYCIGYELAECEEEQGQFILRIEWTSTQEHLNGFRKSEVCPAFFANVKPFVANIQEMRHYRLTEVVQKKKMKT